MKVIVKDNFLNVRAGKASVNAPCYQYIAPGSEIEVDGQLYKGDLFDGIETWMKDAAGNYYWSGGFNNIIAHQEKLKSDFQAFLNSAFDGEKLKSPINYSSFLEIGESVKSMAGKDVMIGILDHPISLSINSTNNIMRPFHIGEPLFNFHANFIAGLIGGSNGITGIANKCKLIELPIYNARANSSGIDIEAVLKFANDSADPMIINISNSLDSRYNDIIKNFKQNKIVVACAGIDNELASAKVRDPASQPNVITVGAINTPRGLLPALNPKIDFVIPNYNYVSFGRSNEQFAKEQGDSFSCAVVTAVIALLISSGKTGYDINTIKNELKKISLPFSDAASFNTFNIINTKS